MPPMRARQAAAAPPGAAARSQAGEWRRAGATTRRASVLDCAPGRQHTQQSMTPLQLPPEWHPQSGVMLAWPHRHSDWVANLAAIDPVYTAIAQAIAARELLLILHYDAAHRRHIEELLARRGTPIQQVRFFEVPTNDTWLRDTAPLTVTNAAGTCVLLDFQFNGWGGKYDATLDNSINARLAALGAFRTVELRMMDLVLEGGSIEVDGQGTLLTTAACLLAKTRNPSLSKRELELQLGEQLGVQRFLWLENGYLAGDDTDSHVDMLARFCSPDTIAYVHCDDPRDEHYGALARMEEELRAFRRADGQPYRLVPLPWPRARHDTEGGRLPASYANFLIINGAVLLPTYDDPADAQAVAALQAVFPGRDIVPIPSLPLITQRGSVHCATMQLPAGVLVP